MCCCSAWCSNLILLLLAFIGFIDIVNAQGNGAVAFYHSGNVSHTYSSGIVRLYYNGMWGNICYRPGSWGQAESDVVCHQMGWSGASVYDPAGLVARFGWDTLPTVLDNADCTNSSYIVLLACTISITTENSSPCTDASDLSLSCYTTRIWQSMPFNGFLRLVDGTSVTEGRVEVYCNGQWGTVCDDALGPEEASTMCRQLGYTDFIRYDHLILPGNSTQPIWLDDVICQQTESCLATCQRCPQSENHNCRHGEDFTVSCTYLSGSSLQIDVNTCINASTGPLASTPSGLAIVGVVVGCGLGVMICILFAVILCCCGYRHCIVSSDDEHYSDEMPEKPDTPSSTHKGPITAVSPEVIMVMEESPKAIRRAGQSDPRYMTHPPKFVYGGGSSVLFSPASSSSRHHPSPTSGTSNNPNFHTRDNLEEPLTPPVFRGQPAPPF